VRVRERGLPAILYMQAPSIIKPAFTRTIRSRAGDAKGRDRCRRKFLRFFRRGFTDQKYIDWERGYKAAAHGRWADELGRAEFRKLIDAGDAEEVARRAVVIESRTNLLFSFEKMALRDDLHGGALTEARFNRWRDAVASLPRRQTRVLTWPVLTVFGFIAQPDAHFFLKPNVTRKAVAEYGLLWTYRSRPNWETYSSLLDIAARVIRDQRAIGARDMIDAQSFLWVQGSDEYEE